MHATSTSYAEANASFLNKDGGMQAEGTTNSCA